MKNIIVNAGILIMLCLNINLAYSQLAMAPAQMEIRTVDVNKDGKPDVFYYRDGKYIGKIEADTNYDGKPDIVIKTKDGKFDSAQVDTDYDGKMDKTFTNQDEFKRWVNAHKPEFKDKICLDDWQFALLKF